MAGFGEQGMAQSRDFAFHVCSICSAKVRMSYYVPIFLGFQLFQLFKYADSLTWGMFSYQVVLITGREILLLATVLCHEFGHGNMARYLGGEIDHVLLWVFGGICFSSRAPYDGIDRRKLLRDDLLVVAAGPTTHIFQAPIWGLLLWVCFLILTHGQQSPLVTGYPNAWEAFKASLIPWQQLQVGIANIFLGKWKCLPFYFAGQAITLNVSLFLFNVFFPMYPADGSKLLVTSLMFCCGVAPRRACNVLLAVSVPCAVLMIVYSVYTVILSFGAGGSGGMGGMLQGMMGFMGVMSLMESWKIYNLRNARQLHTHSLFQTARSWRRTERDAFGAVHRVNVSDLDDETPAMNTGCGTCLAAVCPCFSPNRAFVGQGQTAGATQISESSTARIAQASDLRDQRNRLLDQVEVQQTHQQKTVAELEKQKTMAQLEQTV